MVMKGPKSGLQSGKGRAMWLHCHYPLKAEVLDSAACPPVVGTGVRSVGDGHAQGPPRQEPPPSSPSIGLPG